MCCYIVNHSDFFHLTSPDLKPIYFTAYVGFLYKTDFVHSIFFRIKFDYLDRFGMNFSFSCDYGKKTIKGRVHHPASMDVGREIGHDE